MARKQRQELGEMLSEALDAVAEFGGPDRYGLAQVLGREVYDSLMSKQKTADLIDRWLRASPRTKPAATRALALGIARHVDDPSLVAQIERDLNEEFGTDLGGASHRKQGTNTHRNSQTWGSTKPAPQWPARCL
jgi:hypothetical protein